MSGSAKTVSRSDSTHIIDNGDGAVVASRHSSAPACIELKSLKYYIIEFRNKGIFYEAVTNQILDDLVAACKPKRMTVTGDFSVRGGISTSVTAEYEAES